MEAAGHEVAHGTLAYAKDLGSFPGFHIAGFVLEDYDCSLLVVIILQRLLWAVR